MIVNIAVAGNQWITQYLIESMIDFGFKPKLIINVHPESSNNISGYIDLRGLCNEYKIEIYHPEKYSLKSKVDEVNLKEKVDLLYVFGWQRLIPEWFIKSCKKGVYGVHGGPLKPPRCRGRAVFNWAVILGYHRFYMYFFSITIAADEGDIAQIVEFDINSDDDILTLYHKNCIVSSRMFIEALPKILNGSLKLAKQPGGQTSFLPKRSPQNGGINWEHSAKRVTNLIRALTKPYPGAFSFINGVCIHFFRSHIFDTKIQFDNIHPGEIIEVFPNGDFIVATGDLPLYVREYDVDKEFKLKKGQKFDLVSGEQLQDPFI